MSLRENPGFTFLPQRSPPGSGGSQSPLSSTGSGRPSQHGDDKGNRWHAKKHPNIILFAEKTAYTDLMQGVNRDFDITTIATGGQSSYLSIEHFVDELRARHVDLSGEFVVFSIVDFDPAGDIIATNFVENLMDNGIKNIRIFSGITSNTKRIHEGDTEITEWAKSGLKLPSLATAILQTVKKDRIQKRLGQLDKIDFAKVEKRISAVIGFLVQEKLRRGSE